ncbi:hypothetical protein [Phormidium tenue]|uniref:Uncharacterized protein n=1 Tax=Phormidium tenue NIES-30 TaxID=549789 RepID=A0A1U7J1L6_9CYAN|nr:hypothetical protein [Phormidium tenue]MBD2232234.1 hypothetical protein [Phormidium tenue FACHB-1052]OKH45827.1 hypothetical protein NIES30_18260 [Phormidium tenue NIES-30]
MNSNSALKDYIPLFQTLIGGLLTFIGGLLGSVLIQQRQRHLERKSLASAFHGEIQALIGIVQKRQYIQGIKNAINDLKSGKRITYQMRVTRKYFNVYDENLDKIGILPCPLPEMIVELYTIMTAVLEDLDVINESEFYDADPEVVISHLSELKSLFEYAIESGMKISQKIKSMKLLA